MSHFFKERLRVRDDIEEGRNNGNISNRIPERKRPRQVRYNCWAKSTVVIDTD